MKINLSLDPTKYQKKPSKIDAAQISLNIAKCNKKIELSHFFDAIKNGQTWSSLYNKPERKTKNWAGQQLFCVDLDNNPDLFEILAPLSNWTQKLPALPLYKCLLGFPTIIHESFSSNEEYRKLRIIYVSNQLVTDGILALAILRYLKDFWDNLGQEYTADPCTIQLARVLYGTNSKEKSCTIFPENIFDFDELVLKKEFEKYIYDPRKNLENSSNKSIKKLPDKTDLSNKKHRNLVTIVWEDCQKNIIAAKPSGYQALWNSGRRLAQLGLLSPNWIHNKIMSLVSGLPDYQPENGYKHNPSQIIKNSIEWGSNFCYNYNKE